VIEKLVGVPIRIADRPERLTHTFGVPPATRLKAAGAQRAAVRIIYHHVIRAGRGPAEFEDRIHRAAVGPQFSKFRSNLLPALDQRGGRAGLQVAARDRQVTEPALPPEVG
jgi:hypothetical protein